MQSYSSCRWTWDSLTNVELWMTFTECDWFTNDKLYSLLAGEEAGSQGLMPDCVY